MSTTIKGAPAVQAYQPSDDQVVEFLQQTAVFGEDQRFRMLDRREAFFKSLQYAHQTMDWWGRDADAAETISSEAIMPPGNVPAGGMENLLVRDKRPTAPTNMSRTVTRRYTGFLFSESRKPEILVEGDPDTESFLKAVREAAKFWPTMRMARNKGGAMGSVAVTAHLRDGNFSYEVHNAKNCTPLWADRRTLKLAGLLIMWKFPKTVNVVNKDGKFEGTKTVDFLYRRIISEQQDTIYQEIPVEEASATNWEPEISMSVRHGLGFFPGVWIQNNAESDDIDGDADCEGAYQTIDTNDRLIAQMNFGVLANCDPTLVTKTDPMEVAKLGSAGLAKGSGNGIEVGSKGDAKYLEITGEGIAIGRLLSGDHKQTICDITGLVLIDDKDLAAAQSAKAIEFRFAPMIERADDYRAQYGEAVIDLSRITERIARLFSNMAVPITLPTGDPAIMRFKFNLPPRLIEGVPAPQALGPGGYISLKWGPYFAPTENDKQMTIKNAASANASGFIDKVTAARPVAPLYGVQDVEGTVARAKEENDQMSAEMLAGLDGGVVYGDKGPSGGGRP